MVTDLIALGQFKKVFMETHVYQARTAWSMKEICIYWSFIC